MGEQLYDALYRLFFQEKDLNLFFEMYQNFAFGWLEKKGFTDHIDYHSCQDVVQDASMILLRFKISNGDKYYSKNQFVAMCFNQIKWAAYNFLRKGKLYSHDIDVVEELKGVGYNDKYFRSQFLYSYEIIDKAIQFIQTYELEKVRETLILYFFDDLSLKEIAAMTGLWYRGLKHLINIFIIEFKNELTGDNISVEDYLKNEAPKTIFTQRRLREYIQRRKNV